MSKNAIIGVVGGGLIALSVFIGADGFDGGALSGATALVTFVAGLAVVIFVLTGRLLWAAYSTVAAATVALIGLVAMIQSSEFDLSIGFIVLLVGVVLA